VAAALLDRVADAAGAGVAEPSTSPRAWVRTVPCRWLAWYMTRACLSRFWRTSPPSFCSSTLKVLTFSPDWLKTGTSIIVIVL